MIVNLWVFLTAGVIFTVPFFIIIAINAHKKAMKQLEIEALKIEKINLESVVDEAVNRIVGNQLSRIEVLEAIVTDKNYDLSEKISKA